MLCTHLQHTQSSVCLLYVRYLFLIHGWHPAEPRVQVQVLPRRQLVVQRVELRTVADVALHSRQVPPHTAKAERDDSDPVHTGRARANSRPNSNTNPLMLLACSVDTPIHINRSHLLALHRASRGPSCVDEAREGHNKCVAGFVSLVRCYYSTWGRAMENVDKWSPLCQRKGRAVPIT